jgi:hypothetical protein
MRTFRGAASVFVLGALIAACSDQPTSLEVDSPQFAASGPVVHHASLGGADICEAIGAPTGCDANFSLVANEYADGSASGQWQDSFGHGNGGVHVAIDCLNVQGNVAWVSGAVTKFDADPTQVGQPAITVVVDNGTSANDSPDQLSFSVWFPGAPDCNATLPVLLTNFVFDLTNGQVNVW